MPLVRGGIPMALLEARALGVLVVANGVGGVVEAADLGGTVHSVLCKEPEGMSEALLSVLSRQHNRDGLRDNSPF
jgi:glycosyltransferase involved in cell wall biosynthesis